MRLPLAAHLSLSLSLSLSLFIFLPGARAAEPFFKKGDVIALVGGEDMVVASEYGYLELLLVRALPDYRLRFRNLAWEGDTVFEQRRDLNFPTWEEQLDQIGATVVLAQFGQMESLAGKEKLPEFIAAYEKLIERFSAGGKRRVAVLPPGLARRGEETNSRNRFADAIKAMRFPEGAVHLRFQFQNTRDGFHLNRPGHAYFALSAAASLLESEHRPRLLVPRFQEWLLGQVHDKPGEISDWTPPSREGSNAMEIKEPVDESLRQLIIAKNRLWFDYWRPQNWAFLAGDRTAQPSSRDHLDPSKRWFPPEREAFLPLIEAKEKEIDALAQSLASAEKK